MSIEPGTNIPRESRIITNVWGLRQGQFCWVDGKQYQCLPDKFERRPRLGEVLVRTIQAVSDPEDVKKSLGMGFEVEILP